MVTEFKYAPVGGRQDRISGQKRFLPFLLCLIGWLCIVPGGRVYAQETLEISLSTNTWEIGAIPAGSVFDTWWDAPGTFVVTNAGTVAARLLLSVEWSAPDGWLPAETAGTNTFRMGFMLAGQQPKPEFEPLSQQESLLLPRLEPQSAASFDLEFRAPTGVQGVQTQQTIRVNISALALEAP